MNLAREMGNCWLWLRIVVSRFVVRIAMSLSGSGHAVEFSISRRAFYGGTVARQHSASTVAGRFCFSKHRYRFLADVPGTGGCARFLGFSVYAFCGALYWTTGKSLHHSLVRCLCGREHCRRSFGILVQQLAVLSSRGAISFGAISFPNGLSADFCDFTFLSGRS